MTLLTRFGIASAVLLAIVGFAVAQVLADMIEDRAQDRAEQTGVLAVMLGIGPSLQPDDFTGVVTGVKRETLDRAMDEASSYPQEYGALRLKVFNADGTVIYSDLKEIVGKTYFSEDLKSALAGNVVSKKTQLEDVDERPDNDFGTALEVYVPLNYGLDEAVGVAEIYLPYAPVEQSIRDDTRVLYVTLFLGLLFFYGATFRMVARASSRLYRQAHALREGADRNAYLASHDTLTGLPNRVLLGDRMQRAIVQARRHGTDVGVLLIDLDRFKEINDTLGHDTGDELLCEIGARLTDQLREIDTVARLGGDEFVVLLPDVDSVQAAAMVAQRILDGLRRPFLVRGVELAVEASVGVACYPEHGDSDGQLLQHVDVAMYAAKQTSGTYVVYDPDFDDSSINKMTLLNELRVALDEQQLLLHYQPQVNLEDGTMRGVEALVRWMHPTRGLVGHDEFIPVAEQTALMPVLTSYVIRAALKQARTWQDQGRELAVSVNLSARDLMNPQLPRLVSALLDEAGIDAAKLELEVTETIAMADPVRAIAVLSGLSQLGVAVAIDDYGTGYSSLSYLRRLPIRTLKIDRSFVTNMLTDKGNAVIVKSTIDLAHNLDLEVIAEGVEDADTRHALANLGCHVAQGYYLGQPLPPESLTQVVNQPVALLDELYVVPDYAGKDSAPRSSPPARR